MSGNKAVSKAQLACRFIEAHRALSAPSPRGRATAQTNSRIIHREPEFTVLTPISMFGNRPTFLWNESN